MDQQDDSDPFIHLQAWAQETERRVRRESSVLHLRRRVSLLAPIIIAGLLLVSLVPAIRSRLPAGSTAGDDRISVVPAASISAESGPAPAAAPSAAIKPTEIRSAGPFAGTSAVGYPQGAAGISLPAARAVTGFTTAQVGTALREVRAALIAGRLTPGMLTGHHPQPFLALLAPNDRGPIGQWFKGTKFDAVATWISPAVRLDPAEPPRVSGRVSYASVEAGGLRTLRITTNFVWVYAFGRAASGHPLAAEHDEIRWEFPSAPNLRAGDQGMWIAAAKSYLAWVDCAAAAKGQLAPTGGGAATAADPANTEDPGEYLKPGHTLDISNDCGKG